MEKQCIKGLHNLGNSCFMNSALQCLTTIAPLNSLILSTSDKSPSTNDKLVFGLYKEYLQNYTSLSSNGSISPTSLFRHMKRINQRLTPGRQHDAHEYSLSLLGHLEDVYKKANKLTAFESVFGGKLVSQIICSKCNHASNSFEDMTSISVVLWA